jgi:hypothetical protein
MQLALEQKRGLEVDIICCDCGAKNCAQWSNKNGEPQCKKCTAYEQKYGKPRARQTLKFDFKNFGKVCSNCRTKKSAKWRYNSEGDLNCNRCYNYFWYHKEPRPLEPGGDGESDGNYYSDRNESDEYSYNKNNQSPSEEGEIIEEVLEEANTAHLPDAQYTPNQNLEVTRKPSRILQQAPKPSEFLKLPHDIACVECEVKTSGKWHFTSNGRIVCHGCMLLENQNAQSELQRLAAKVSKESGFTHNTMHNSIFSLPSN